MLLFDSKKNNKFIELQLILRIYIKNHEKKKIFTQEITITTT